MKLLDGRTLLANIKEELKSEVAAIIDHNERPPHLAAVLVGNDPSSLSYVASKEKACHQVGITSSVYQYPENFTENELLQVIDFLNNDQDIDGYIVQLPLPPHIDPNKIIQSISPDKDVDGFHPYNLGRMMMGQPSFIPATPLGIMQMLERYQIETQGKHCVVLGRSMIVGTPVSILLSRKAKPGNATVTLCHSYTQNLKEICLSADILIVAIGKPHFVTADMVKEGSVVIDVGIHRIPDSTKEKGYTIVGDVDFEEVSKKTEWISPVPGGVGNMTIAGLLMNTLKAWKQRNIRQNIY
ncbi:MAG: tetrahydrofolate dehydrogenase/cyclohydrolase catalytic domain-containing protein [Lentimicrobium sp.]|jgi:methylenetetrahydrofolate dehydrogenase (NADP+)/methenyltetrahydrofolate cyclohydrolase